MDAPDPGLLGLPCKVIVLDSARQAQAALGIGVAGDEGIAGDVVGAIARILSPLGATARMRRRRWHSSRADVAAVSRRRIAEPPQGR